MSENNLNNILCTPLDPACAPHPRGLGVLFMECLKKYSDNIAQIDADTGETQTYGEILVRSIRVAEALKKRGLKANDIITLCSYNHMDCVLPLLAALYLGIHVSSLDPSLPIGDVQHLLQLVKPSLIFCGQESVSLVNNVIRNNNLNAEIIVYGNMENYASFSEFLIKTDTEKDFEPTPIQSLYDTAIIYFSSGTTGLPKAICTTHKGLMVQQKYLLKDEDVSTVLYFTTFYWISAVMLLIMNIMKGGARVICRQFSEDVTFELIKKYKVTYMFLSPFHVNKLLHKYKAINYDTSHFKTLIIGGGKVSEEQMMKMRALLPHTYVTLCYGMTEACGCVVVFNKATDGKYIDARPASSGRPIPGIDYKVVDVDTEEVVGANKPGELRVRSTLLMNAYLNDVKSTEAAWDNEGFFRTGDVGYYDRDQCFFIIDRIKDIMKYQSWHIIPMELEDILISHPDVKEAAVVGRPHDIDGEHPMAFIILNAAAKSTETDLMNYYNEHITGADRKQLRGGIRFVDYIPRTPTGKLRRMHLKQLYFNIQKTL